MKVMFYYFVEAEIDPPSKPLVLWLNGGFFSFSLPHAHPPHFCTPIFLSPAMTSFPSPPPAMAAARPRVSVHNLDSDIVADGATTTLPLPDVMQSSIRPDIITFVHTNMSKHSRQPYAVSPVPSEPCVAAAACSLRRRSGDRWHRRITINQNRSAVPSLVMARGHRIKSVPEISLSYGE